MKNKKKKTRQQTESIEESNAQFQCACLCMCFCVRMAQTCSGRECEECGQAAPNFENPQQSHTYPKDKTSMDFFLLLAAEKLWCFDLQGVDHVH